jgi:hypothetical protein
MTPDRVDHLTTQYLWALENEHVFVTKARHEAERDNFYLFQRLVADTARPIYRALDDVLRPEEWAYLYLELWHRMGGYEPNYGWHSDNADRYHRCKRHIAEAVTTDPIQSTETPEETNMSNQITFKTVTYINNNDVMSLTDEQLITYIKAIEREIDGLKSVATKSKKIDAKIAEAEGVLAKVVEILDAR